MATEEVKVSSEKAAHDALRELARQFGTSMGYVWTACRFRGLMFRRQAKIVSS
jgi:hypothetical protein